MSAASIVQGRGVKPRSRLPGSHGAASAIAATATVVSSSGLPGRLLQAGSRVRRIMSIASSVSSDSTNQPVRNATASSLNASSLVIDGEIVDARGAVIAARGDLVGWRPLLSERIPPVVARARSKAAVLALEREGVLEALLLDFDLVVELARSLALAATPRLEPGPALLAPSVVDRARELRAIEPFDRLPLDAVLEVAAQLSGDPPQAALVRAFAGAEGAASDENVLLDALEDHPRSAIEVLAWLAERAEEATRSCRASA